MSDQPQPFQPAPFPGMTVSPVSPAESPTPPASPARNGRRKRGTSRKLKANDRPPVQEPKPAREVKRPPRRAAPARRPRNPARRPRRPKSVAANALLRPEDYEATARHLEAQAKLLNRNATEMVRQAEINRKCAEYLRKFKVPQAG